MLQIKGVSSPVCAVYAWWLLHSARCFNKLFVFTYLNPDNRCSFFTHLLFYILGSQTIKQNDAKFTICCFLSNQKGICIQTNQRFTFFSFSYYKFCSESWKFPLFVELEGTGKRRKEKFPYSMTLHRNVRSFGANNQGQGWEKQVFLAQPIWQVQGKINRNSEKHRWGYFYSFSQCLIPFFWSVTFFFQPIVNLIPVALSTGVLSPSSSATWLAESWQSGHSPAHAPTCSSAELEVWKQRKRSQRDYCA